MPEEAAEIEDCCLSSWEETDGESCSLASFSDAALICGLVRRREEGGREKREGGREDGEREGKEEREGGREDGGREGKEGEQSEGGRQGGKEGKRGGGFKTHAHVHNKCIHVHVGMLLVHSTITNLG